MENKILFAFSFLIMLLFFILGIFVFVDKNIDADFLRAQIIRFVK